ncbi:S41 family peptidase [Calderihabitans maritimus]|uniref:C-terminal processing peptidase-3 n=1 Tax=Calderihabitans maritimus TaxID=1246530 RepID=A0A1Z5HV08_9FIRM|nr:S41 family peptidase [Calderihabitans maritimus]GAW93175.1 C-terminal processing peptidase-3 [Calderihabitans maritimus]
MNGNNRLWRGIIIGIVVTFIVITATLGVVVASNYSHLGRFVKVVSLIKTQALEPVSMAELVDGAMKGMVEALKDPYSVYMEPKAYKHLETHIKGTYGGVGLLITMEKGNKLTVVSPFKGTPAHRAGIKAGDVIVKIDDRETVDMDIETAANLMKGHPGTQVTLWVQREGVDKLLKFEVTRDKIKIPSVNGQILEDYPEIAYINITMFNEHTGRELGELLAELKEKEFKGIILDLRNNPGGSLSAAIDVAGYFIPKGPVVYLVSKHETIPHNTEGRREKYPLVVLVNKGSASASEIVAGAIKDTNSGIIVGETTFGKGLVQTVFQLDGGAAVKLTTAKYLTPAKNDIHEKGIKPDVEVKLDPELESQILMHAPDTEKDAQLLKAIEILQKEI